MGRFGTLPFLEDLYEVTHENVQIAMLDGAEVVYVERIFDHTPTRIAARPGTRLPVHVTGVGRVLLAHAPGDAIDEILALHRAHRCLNCADVGPLCSGSCRLAARVDLVAVPAAHTVWV
jgi:hypothetical protein